MNVDGLLAANSHLDKNDLPALTRLAYIYEQLDSLMLGGEDSPLQGKLMLDEFHRLCSDALRLEQELALTYSARRTRLGGVPTGWPPLSSIKSDDDNS